MSDSDSDSDLYAYSHIAEHFLEMVKQREENPTSPKKKLDNRFRLPELESPLKTDQPETLSDSDSVSDKREKPSTSAQNGVSESVEINDDDSNLSTSNLEDAISIGDSPEEDNEVDEDGPIYRRTRRNPKRACATPKKKTPVKKKTTSPAKKKKIEASISLLEDDEDNSFTLPEEPKEDPNPEIVVKIQWRHQALEKIPVRKFQKIERIYEHFAEKEKVPINRIVLSLNEKLLKPSDTPDSLGLKITDFLEGGLLSEVTSAATVTEAKPERRDKDSIALKVIRENIREPVTIRVKKSDAMRIFMIKVAEELKLQEGTFKLYFDGETVQPDDTPESLDLDGDERFDLKIL